MIFELSKVKGFPKYYFFNHTGGYNGSILEDVLMFDQKVSDWKKVGRMKTARVYHGASLVNMLDVMKYF